MSGSKTGSIANSDARAKSSNYPLVVVGVVAVVLGVLIWLSMGLQPDGAGSVTQIDNDELRELVSEGALLVDVRTQSEYDAGHIEGAILAPMDSVAALAEGWDRDTPIVLYCATGARSADAARALETMGFEVYDLVAGVIAWDGSLSTESVEAPTGGGGQATSDLPVMYEFLTDS
jgi:rhodanese-related sulfurtransferase